MSGGQNTFTVMATDDAGNEVTYVNDIRGLLGYGSGTIVYLGWGWRRDWQVLLPRLRDRGYVLDEVLAC